MYIWVKEKEGWGLIYELHSGLQRTRMPNKIKGTGRSVNDLELQNNLKNIPAMEVIKHIQNEISGKSSRT